MQAIGQFTTFVSTKPPAVSINTTNTTTTTTIFTFTDSLFDWHPMTEQTGILLKAGRKPD